MKNNFSSKEVISFFILSLFVAPLISSAQSFNAFPELNFSKAYEGELQVNIDPQYPRPNEMVYISLELYTDNLDSALITWIQDNKIFVQNKGLKKYSFRAGPVGTDTTIEIRIDLQNGISFSKKFTLTPASVDIVWESDSYVPPFYKGKALHPKQGRLFLVAMPEFVKNGKRISPDNLIYKWSNGLDVYYEQSGYGKNILGINGSILGQNDRIELLVTSPENGLSAEYILDVPTINPSVYFYEVSPFYGPNFDQALAKSIDMKGEEMEVLGVPYFASDMYKNLNLKWSLNKKRAPELDDFRSIVFRKPEDTSGTSLVSLYTENQSRILQQANGAFSIKFKED